ncbi:hypothetical protein [Flavobacterium sp.]|jgi:hypothetical protein|uniref:hypothetical protein n=1 Tax=Flavobacterium sp. TaxID=239 RepID=UPI0037BEADC7
MKEEIINHLKGTKQLLSAFQIARIANVTEKEIQPVLDDLCAKSILEKLRFRTPGAYSKINNYYKIKR